MAKAALVALALAFTAIFLSFCGCKTSKQPRDPARFERSVDEEKRTWHR